MHIYQRGKNKIWWVDLGVVDGRRLRQSLETQSKVEANKRAAQLASKLWDREKLGFSTQQNNYLWDDAVIAWVEEHQHLKTLNQIKFKLTWWSKYLRGMPLNRIDSNMIRELILKLNKNNLSNATINRYLSDLSRILNSAYKRNWLQRVPHFEKRSEGKVRVNWLTPIQAQELISELSGIWKNIVTFALATGLRANNIRLLKWSQVDLERQIAWIHADEAKAGKNIQVPLNQSAMTVLNAQKGFSRDWVFPSTEDSQKPFYQIPSKSFNRACKKIGLDNFRFHDLRHTWASWHVQNGTPLAVLQELGGWASLSMVQRYAHLGQSHLASWSNNSDILDNREKS